MLIQNHSMLAANRTVDRDASSSNATPTSSNGVDPNSFMTLLVAEIQNQDPTQPMDPTTFMSQLVQLNELQQTIQINQLLQQNFGTTGMSSANTSN